MAQIEGRPPPFTAQITTPGECYRSAKRRSCRWAASWASAQRQGGSHASRTDCPCHGSRWIDSRYSDGCRPSGGVILSRTLLCAEGERAAELQLQDLSAMKIYN